MEINEREIKDILKIQNYYANEAKRMADKGYLEKTAELFTKVKLGYDNVCSLLMGLTPGKKCKIIPVTEKMLRMAEENKSHYFARETKKIYNECREYCIRKLGEHEFRKILN